MIESGWDGVSIRISYNKYPTLPVVILGLLKSADSSIFTEAAGSAAAEAVFPALDIVRRAGPPEEYREELWGHITGYLGSQIWHVREIAARTLCSFLLHGDWTDSVRDLLEGAKNDANRIHGVLLTVRFYLERMVSLNGEVDRNGESYQPSPHGTLLTKYIGISEVEALLGDNVLSLPAFKSCPIAQAAYLEIFNLLPKFGPGELLRLDEVLGPGYREQDAATLPAEALLRTEDGIKLVQDAADTRLSEGTGDFENMRAYLLENLTRDTNTACRMLEVMPTACDKVQSQSMAALNLADEITPQLCGFYTEVCHLPAAPEIHAQALLNLASLVDKCLLVTHRRLDEMLPNNEELDRLWVSLQRKGEIINPTLACAIIKASGSLMAAAVRLSEGDEHKTQSLERRLRNWGVMIADSLDVENV